MRAYSYGRFSSKKQEEGMSVERQSRLERDWLERHNLTLDDTFSYFDRGVSGFRGKHRRKGGLSLFLAACEAGRIARGSVLLVEAIDRLSRENPFDFMALLKTLLHDYGIRIVTTSDSQEYTAKNYPEKNLMLTMFANMAHAESQRKSGYSTATQERRRKLKIITKRCPSWLSFSEVDQTEKVKTLRRIFDWSSKGFGMRWISKKLNEGSVPVLGQGKRWHESTISHVLSNRAVLGEFQPMKLVEGVRQPAGEVRVNYYPRVITDTLWESSRTGVMSRKQERGRITPRVSNLFSKLVYHNDEEAGYRPRTKRGYGTLTRADNTPGIRYDVFERVFLWWITEAKITIRQDNNSEDYREQAVSLDSKVKQLEARIKADPNLISMLDTVSEWKARHKELIEKADACAVPMQSHFLQGQRLIERLKEAKPEELEVMRRELKLCIRTTVERIEINREDILGGVTEVVVEVKMRDQTWHQFWFQYSGAKIVHGGTCNEMGDVIAPARGPSFPPDDDAPVMVPADRVSVLLAEGKKLTEIAEIIGVSLRKLNYHISAQRGERGEMTRAEARAARVVERTAQAKKLNGAGKSIAEIAEIMGVDKVSVRRYLRLA